MEQRLSVVTLGVADLTPGPAVLRGAGLEARQQASRGGVLSTERNGVVLVLPRERAEDALVPPEGSGFAGVVLAYNARSRDEVDGVLAEAERAGARILKSAQDVFWGGYSGYFADPDGHLWEVAWNPEWELTASGDVKLNYL